MTIVSRCNPTRETTKDVTTKNHMQEAEMNKMRLISGFVIMAVVFFFAILFPSVVQSHLGLIFLAVMPISLLAWHKLTPIVFEKFKEFFLKSRPPYSVVQM